MNWKELCKGCGICCGCVPITEGFLLAHKFLITVPYKINQWNKTEIVPVTDDFACVFWDKEKGCKIYDERPNVCRKQGTIAKLPCPKIIGGFIDEKIKSH